MKQIHGHAGQSVIRLKGVARTEVTGGTTVGITAPTTTPVDTTSLRLANADNDESGTAAGTTTTAAGATGRTAVGRTTTVGSAATTAAGTTGQTIDGTTTTVGSATMTAAGTAGRMITGTTTTG